jgi:hypothetical protein
MKFNKKILTTLILGSLFSTQSFAQESNWDFSAELYAIAVNIDGDARVGDSSRETLPVDMSTGDILDILKMGGMFHTEGLYKDTWGYSLDYSFMNLGESGQFKGFENIRVGGNVHQGVLEAKAFKRYEYDFGTIDYMAGIRWWDNDIDANLSISELGGARSVEPNGDLSVDWVDYVIGARYMNKINNDWTYFLTTDIGTSKDTDFTGQIHTGFRYQINDWSDLNLSYKSVWVDYDNEEDFAYSTTTHGAIVGYAVYF